MAVTAYWYGNALLKALNKEIDWNSDTIKIALCTSSYTPDQDTHDYYDDITNELTTTGGYTAGGATLANCAVTYTAGTNVIKLDADDVTWSALTATFRYAVIYLSTGTAATSPLIGYVNLDTDRTASGEDYTIQWSADGILKATVS